MVNSSHSFSENAKPSMTGEVSKSSSSVKTRFFVFASSASLSTARFCRSGSPSSSTSTAMKTVSPRSFLSHLYLYRGRSLSNFFSSESEP